MYKVSLVMGILVLTLFFNGCAKQQVNSTNLIAVEQIAKYKTNKKSATEIVAFDEKTNRIFSTNDADNTLDIIQVIYDEKTKKAKLQLLSSIDLSKFGASVQSVAVKNSKVAAAIGSTNKIKKKGKVVVFNTNAELLSQTIVGYLPDMVTFNEDGTKILVANEAEPDATFGKYKDVEGSIGIITLSNTDKEDNSKGYKEVTFSNANLLKSKDNTKVRLGKSNDKSLDLEPEYITVSENYAYITLQENNALAKVDINKATLEFVKSFGVKDYTLKNKIDIEEEGKILLKNYKGLYGLYMPDSIASYKVNNKTYLVTANEGDGRTYCSKKDINCKNPIFTDEEKISKLKLDSSLISTYQNENDLKVLTDMGDIDFDGDYDRLYAFGTRSFSIWDSNGDLIWDSLDELSILTANYMPTLFNQDKGKMDKRSGNKGIEPEALTVGKIDEKIYAFIGLERQNAIIVYNITNPYKPSFVKYIISNSEDLSPEGMTFISKENSPTKNALLLVAFEGSGSIVMYEIK
ncbi:choice-of-anchor I family protein [Malaciobacter mytili]|uniref:choice-of-anchor I family protein n=1 Tax=Malaciobacter mytili TaxID=603050 RepID=UPI003BB00BEB